MADNPHSGKLIISQAQLVDLYRHDVSRAADMVESALRPGTTWLGPLDRANSLAIGRAILTKAGRTEEAARVQRIIDSIAIPDSTGTEQ